MTRYALRIFLLFARPLQFWNFSFSMLALLSIYMSGMKYTFPGLLIKLASYIGGATYQYYMDNRAYYFFRNSGYSVKWLYACTFAADLLIYTSFVYVFTYLYHGSPHPKS